MLKRRRRIDLPAPDVNVVPLMDILTTLLFFIVIMASVSKLSTVSSGISQIGNSSEQDQRPKFRLEIVLFPEKKVTIRLGPIKGLKMIEGAKLESYLNEKYKKLAEGGFELSFTEKMEDKLAHLMSTQLMEIKKAFPHEMEAIFMVGDNVDYQSFITVIGNIREIPPNDPPFTFTNILGHKKEGRTLFPDVILVSKDER